MLKRNSMGKIMDEPIRKMVTKRLIGVISGTTIQEGVRRMLEFDIGFLVITSGKDVVGFMTHTDIKRAIADGRSMDDPVDTIMTREPRAVDINTSVREALEIMSKNRYKRLLVTENEEVAGIITRWDIEDIDKQRLETFISRE